MHLTGTATAVNSVRRDREVAWLDASEDPEPIMLAEGAKLDSALEAILRSEVGLDTYTPAQLSRWVTMRVKLLPSVAGHTGSTVCPACTQAGNSTSAPDEKLLASCRCARWRMRIARKQAGSRTPWQQRAAQTIQQAAC